MTATQTITELLTRTREKAEQRHALAAVAYAKLVRDVAEGKEADSGKLLTQLEQLGRDPAKFSDDVQAFRTRIELRAQVDKLPELVRERAKIEEAVTGHNQKLQEAIAKAEAEHTAAVQPLLAKNDVLGSGIAAAEEAKNQLRRTSNEEQQAALNASLRAAAAQSKTVERLEAELADARDRQLHHALEELSFRQNAAAKPQIATGIARNLDHVAAQEREALAREVQNAEARVKDLRAAVEKLENETIPQAKAELEGLRAEVAKCEAALLVP